MLSQAANSSEIIARLAGDPVGGFTVRNFYNTTDDQGAHPVVLVNNIAEPNVLLIHRGSNFMIHGEMAFFPEVLGDLLHGRVEQNEGWPDSQMKKDWDTWLKGHRGLFLNSCALPVWRAAIGAGFHPHPEDVDDHVAYMWYWQGKPRFGHLIKHDCRLGEGEELLELLKQGVHYDPEGEYIRSCLVNGPSFVCEVAGEPVCWSCTHVNGTMGMIYTPEQNRRKGYAYSLSAFQLDYMLKRDGIACAHIIDSNIPSMKLVLRLGAERWLEPVIWRSVYWPGEAPQLNDTSQNKQE
jgi:hypothetical protein